jgi:hypothetical protein
MLLWIEVFDILYTLFDISDTLFGGWAGEEFGIWRPEVD